MVKTLTVELDRELFRPGFSLYVLEATTSDGTLLYVGMTRAQSLFARLCGNLSAHPTLGRAREYLRARGVEDLATCDYRMVACRFTDEGLTPGQVGALERKLAEDLRQAGYEVLNEVTATGPVNEGLYEQVRTAFGSRFSLLLPAGSGSDATR